MPFLTPEAFDVLDSKGRVRHQLLTTRQRPGSCITCLEVPNK